MAFRTLVPAPVQRLVVFNVQRLKELSADERAALGRRSESDLSTFFDKVQPIIDAVRRDGDDALVRLGHELDRAESLRRETLRASPEEFDEALRSVDAEVIEAIRYGS